MWLACLALLFNGLLPAMAGGMGVDNAIGSIGSKFGVLEVCSVDGVKLFDAVTGKLIKPVAGKSALGKQHLAAHCAYCLAHAGQDFVLHGPVAAMLQVNISESAPLLFYQSPHAVFIWTAAQPRGPPVYLM